MSSSDPKRKRLNQSSMSQIQILNALADGVSATGEAKKFQIDEIAEQSGLFDEKEAQRFLFILEGQKLVSPFPQGDFTAKTWYITPEGLKALKYISNAAA
jgi:hypothetical protein